jgi:YrbI family 3-deoxy-D-manno-octulosonate 8-phosphate phosphatase
MKYLNKYCKRLKEIKLIVFDFDGVFTDNKVIVDETGKEYVTCSRFDGLGLERLRKMKLASLILSTEKNGLVRKRAKKLKIECVNDCPDKLAKLKEIAKDRKLSLSEIAFVGNDINDFDCLCKVGVPIIVADAHSDLKKYFKNITEKNGGHGAVREICDELYKLRDIR